ncbi:hypothetical protein Patl1_30458 [Pistacia atlantica]|uniref:Uncharacterized protein n=1 Tax=Pistacia atlantica TaxID=434234 RepID=A0ACC1ACR7_9ROSI|nr:hypothetical protein Patl1_30458 [Pistacia atlantica]
MKSLLPSATISSFSPPPLSLLNHYSIKPHLKTNLNFNPKNLTLQTHSTASQPPLFYFNLYLQLYVNAGSMQQARNLFDQMPHSQRTVISWTILMSGYTKHGPVYETLLMFIFMLSHGSVWPDAFVYSIVLRACSRVKDLSFGCGVHGLVLKRGGVVDGFVYNALVNMYASCGRLDDAIAVFQGLEKPDLVAWSSMLSGYVKNGLEEEGLRIFLEMICCGVELDSFVFSMVIKGCANLEELEFGKQIHCCMIKMGFGTYLFLENSLMDFYARCGDSKGMRRVFGGMFERNLVSWNTLIMGYVHNSLYLEGLKVFRILMEEVSECDDFTITSSLKAITSVDKLDLGREVHGHIIRVGLESNQYVFGSLLDMYIECVNHEILNPRADLPMRLYNYFNGEKFNGHFIASMLKWCSLLSNLETGKMFHSLIIKLDLNSDPYVISSLIDMYFKCGISEAALRFDYIEANEFTFTSVLLACLVLQDLRKGRELHCKILRAGYGSNVSVVNMLMHLYSELWHYKQALKLCSLISGVDISWNLLLKACIKAKDNEMVHQILRRIQMCYGFVDPYSACYILNSCANPVLLNVGRQAQAYMTKRGVISHPTTRNCLINMYSGCGIIDDADLAFKSMPEKNPLSYRSMISARVFLMLGKWDDASKMKVENRTMRTNSSWIEIRNKIYEFVSDQKPSKEVSDKLAEIEEKMKESGYVVNRIQLMPTIEEEEYDGGGLHHGEMKAVALGLITLPHGLPIRVMKSVRMCGHCHYACKLISTFIDREIVVKDPSNFHHFIGGNCSCRDIW